jgi:PAS domain S-box-containing protein
MIGYNSAAALSFDDPDSAKTTLKSLTARSFITAAAVYDENGKLFAKYQGPSFHGTFTPPPIERERTHFGAQNLEVFRDITLDGDYIGTVYLCNDLSEFHSRWWRYSGVVLLEIAAASLVAYLLSKQLQRFISGPISHLAEVARSVAKGKDYSVRAEKLSNDELGQLIDGFNAMLDQIQQRDSALEAARSDLEHRVDERTQELANSISLLNATLNSTEDGILAHQFKDDTMLYNQKFIDLWGLPPDIVETKDNQRMIEFCAAQVKDRAAFFSAIERAQKRPDDGFANVIELSDGRAFERYLQPQKIDGKTVGVVVNLRDITARREAETRLDTVHKQLLETSRKAGMAEVATSVLHNVGNVLNSVNVSCSVISDRVRRLRIESITKVADLLRQKSNDLAGFFSADPAGQKLPAFLSKVAESLLQDQQSVLSEVNSLTQNVDHIKQIVSVQQSYANIGGVQELICVESLVEDALRINSTALTRHQVQVAREFEPNIPEASLEKHKVLQILVNLIRNAKHAMTDSQREDKRLTLKTSREDGFVSITVADNGIGIAPENMTRIFAHGFTTKKGGHGFGLHSGVLAAKEMGGSLTVFSEGLGHGAAFTLKLPLNATK